MATVYLSFGSNTGNRAENIKKALKELDKKGILIRSLSSFYQTEPMHNQNQPDFINCCAEAHVSMNPEQCLAALKETEKELGRDPGAPRYSPRIIDIDLLYYDNIIHKSETLTIPHPQIRGRRFVLAPLSEIAPDFTDPVSGITVKEALLKPECSGKAAKMESK